jgi:predicted O-methyltransferase YrrM
MSHPDDSLRQFLARHAAEFQPRSYLEIGTRDGDSLRIVLEHAHTLELVCCADTWGGEWGGTGRGGHDHIDAMLASMLFVGEVRYLDGDSKQTIPTLTETFDLILVDGDHSEEGGRADLENVWPLCAPGGCIVFHDITHPAHLYLGRVFDEWVFSHADDISLAHTITEGHGVGFILRK